MMARRRRAADGKLDPKQGLVKIPPSLAVSPSGEAPAGGAASARLAALTATPVPADQVTVQPPLSPRARNASAADDNDLDFNAATGRAAPAAVPNADLHSPAPELTPAQEPRPEPAHALELPRAAQPPWEPPSAPPPPRMTEPPARAPQAGAAEPLMPDFALDASSPSAPSIKAEPAAPAPDPHTVDFNLEPLPPVNAPMNIDKVSSEPPAAVDFKLDLNDLDINAPAQHTSGGPARDDHWYDVQQKFDLAKAYEEMGDKDGARDILQEVMREGDTEQQAQAKKLLGSLG
jgi:pilus assembly protein FimV